MTAKVYTFPSAVNVRMVPNVSRMMQSFGTIDEAEQHLFWHLDVHWDRLEAFGVDDAEIEMECRAFARAAWAHYQKLQQEAGVA
jgi:hypothetical protein